MSKYGLNRYNLSYYGIGDDYKYLTTYFVATPFNYGSIRLDWAKPGGSWSDLVLVRNTLGFPVDPDDGEVVLISDNVASPLSAPDSGLREGIIYYYSLFVKDTTFSLWHKSGDASAISVKNFNTADFMWELIPTGMRSNTRDLIDGAEENPHLKEFISLLAFEYDIEKTQAYIMTPASNALRISHKFLPALMQQFGLDFEPSLGYQRSRSLVSNAIDIYRSKGSNRGISLFIKSFSGYDASVTPGINMMLDYNSSSFEESVGLWTAVNSAISSVGSGEIAPYNEPARPVAYPNRQLGSLKAVSDGGSVTLTCGTNTVLDSIPVVAGTNYTFSIYTTAGSTGRDITLQINWYDRLGNLLSTSTGSSVTNSTTTWGSRPYVADAAPADARFAIPAIGIAGTSVGEIHYFDAAQFEVGLSATFFEDARLLDIHLTANRINELSNPNFEVAVLPWTTVGTSSDVIIETSGPNAHNTVSGYAIELYPNAPLVQLRSEQITSVLSGNSYAFSIYAQLENYGGTPGPLDLITATIEWYDSGDVLIGSSVGTPLQGSFSEWTRPSVVGTAPEGVSYAVVVASWTPSSYDLSIVFDAALFEKNAFVDSYFDGTSGFANVSDLMWEGTPNESRSHYYKNFATIYSRLNEMIPEYLTYGSTFELEYAMGMVEP